MEYGFAVLMFIFAGALLIYAGLAALTKDYRILPVKARVSVKPKDPKTYTLQFSKVIALAAAAPALGGLFGLLHPVAGVIVLIAGLAAAIWLGTKIMKKVN